MPFYRIDVQRIAWHWEPCQRRQHRASRSDLSAANHPRALFDESTMPVISAIPSPYAPEPDVSTVTAYWFSVPFMRVRSPTTRSAVLKTNVSRFLQSYGSRSCTPLDPDSPNAVDVYMSGTPQRNTDCTQRCPAPLWPHTYRIIRCNQDVISRMQKN